MTSELANFAARLREFFTSSTHVAADVRRLASKHQTPNTKHQDGIERSREDSYAGRFDALELELFAMQFASNDTYRRLCEARGVSPAAIQHWTQIPAAPTSAFKEFDLTCLRSAERTNIFHSSGTSGQRPSRHFHSAESMAIYEASLWPWFARHLLADLKGEVSGLRLVILTPPPAQAPHSSLVHMFETVRRQLGTKGNPFAGRADKDGSWRLDFDSVTWAMECSRRDGRPMLLVGTAFSFVHLVDTLEQMKLQFQLPPGSRVMETGGYKGRSRSLPKAELHTLITHRLGIPPSHIVCEYGMSELSSQAYDGVSGEWRVTSDANPFRHPSPVTRHFHFPPWVRVQIVSPETGLESGEGETGLIRVFDLANVFSVMAVQTEDLAVRGSDGFELLGRAALAEPRGCSLMALNS